MPAKRTQTASAPEFQASTLDEWKSRSTMEVVLESGAKVVIRAMTLDELAAQDGLPDDLLRVAMLEQLPGGVVAEIARQLQEGEPASLAAAKKLSEDNLQLRDRLVLEAVVEPELTPGDLAELDPFDRTMIAEFAQHRRIFDAAGRRVGADALDTFRIFGQEHSCPSTCEACEATARRVFEVQ